MTLAYQREPIVGERFVVTASEFVGTAKVQMFLGQKLVASIECPDPPCHEAYVIPRGTKGAVLRVVARDGSGATEVLELTILESGESTMTAGM